MSLRDDLAAVLGPGNNDAVAYAQADSVLAVLARHPSVVVESEEGPMAAVPSPTQLRIVAVQLRSLTQVQRMQPFDRVMRPPAASMIADALDECARLRAAPQRERERRLEARVDGLSILATSRRLPLAAIEGLCWRAESELRAFVSVTDVRAALAATEPTT